MKSLSDKLSRNIAWRKSLTCSIRITRVDPPWGNRSVSNGWDTISGSYA